jgi:hypothetical protein
LKVVINGDKRNGIATALAESESETWILCSLMITSDQQSRATGHQCRILSKDDGGFHR